MLKTKITVAHFVGTYSNIKFVLGETIKALR